MLIAVFTYTFKSRHNRSQRLQNFFACSIATVNTTQFCVILVKALFPALEKEKCVVFRTIQIACIAMSRSVTHLFLNERLKGLSRPQTSRDNRILKAVSVLVIVVSAAQVAVNCSNAFDEEALTSCNEGRKGYHMYTGSSLLIGSLQLTVLGLILWKLFNHSKLLTATPSMRDEMNASNVVMKAVLKRIGCSSVVFVTSDVTFVVYLIAKSRVTYWHAYLASLNLTVNLTSILFSHNDYHRRFFPFRSFREARQIRVNTVSKKGATNK